MAGKINLGDREFGALPSGGYLNAAKNKPVFRWTYYDYSAPLTGLNSVGVTSGVSVTSNNGIVNIQKVIGSLLFFDSSAGAIYDVSTMLSVYPLDAQVVNKDTVNGVRLMGGRDYQSLNILCSIDQTLGTISFSMNINGADILAQTGITPGAGDSVTFRLSFQYET